MLKGELIVKSQPEKMCDCIIFQDDKKIALVELKSKSLHVGVILDKFTNSGKKSIPIATFAGAGVHSRLFFILLAKSYGNNSAFERLRRSQIKIHGKKYRIIFGRCGGSLKNFIH